MKKPIPILLVSLSLKCPYIMQKTDKNSKKIPWNVSIHYWCEFSKYDQVIQKMRKQKIFTALKQYKSLIKTDKIYTHW